MKVNARTYCRLCGGLGIPYKVTNTTTDFGDAFSFTVECQCSRCARKWIDFYRSQYIGFRDESGLYTEDGDLVMEGRNELF